MVIDFELKSNTSSGPSRNLQSFSVFSDLSSEEAEIINNIIIKKRFLKDQLILSEEDTSNFMYLVYSGKVRVVKINDEEREQSGKKLEEAGEILCLENKTFLLRESFFQQAKEVQFSSGH